MGMKLKDFETLLKCAGKLGLQVYAPIFSEFDESRLPKGKLKITNGDDELDKPMGAFWTSSLKGGKTDWISWCQTNSPRYVENTGGLFEPKGAKVLTIKTWWDYQDLLKIYGRVVRWGKEDIVVLDWVAIAKDYDGVNSRAIDKWDAESTAWFDMNKLKFLRKVDLNKKCSISGYGKNPFDDYNIT